MGDGSLEKGRQAKGATFYFTLDDQLQTVIPDEKGDVFMAQT